MLAPLLGCLLLCLPLSPRNGGEVVVLRLPGAPRPAELIDALRIEMAGSATVSDGPVLHGDDTGERVANAGRTVERSGQLAVWVEPSAPRAGLELHVVAASPSGPVHERHRVAAAGPSAARGLALKVHEALDRSRRATGVIRGQPSTGVIRGQPSPGVIRARPAAMLALGVAGGTSAAGQQAAVVAAAGVRLPRQRFGLELYGQGQLVSEPQAERAEGRVEASEWGLGAGVRALRTTGRIESGAGLEVAARRIEVRGLDGQDRDTLACWLAAATARAEVRYRVTPAIALQATLGLEITVPHQRFSVNEVTILDVGRVRGILGLSAVLRLPL